MDAKNDTATLSVEEASAGQLGLRKDWSQDPSDRVKQVNREDKVLAYGMYYHHAGLLISASDQGISVRRKTDSMPVDELPPVTTYSVAADNGHMITILIIRS